MKSILIIWQEIPDDTDFIVLLKLDEEEFAFLLKCHNKYINSDSISEEEQKQLNDFFYREDGSFKLYKTKTIQKGTFDAVIFTGMIL